MTEVDRISLQFAHEHIPVVGLKNVGIARGIYDCVGCVPIGRR